MTDEGTSDVLDRDTYHKALSNSRRRSVIRALDQFGSLEKGELATLVAAEEQEKEPEELHGDERKRVVVSLGQQHLDRLADWDIIEIERDSMIHRGTYFDEVAAGLPENQETQTMNLSLENADVRIEGATVYIRGTRKD